MESHLTPLELLKRVLATCLKAIAAKLTGSGAIAQGQDATALGDSAVNIGGNNYGSINTGVIIELGTQPGASPEAMCRAYLARILAQADQLPLFSARDSAKAQVKLSKVYTALLTQRSESDIAIERTANRASPEHAAKRLSALEVLNAESRLVLLGGPGSGKSTFANFVALALAGERLGSNGPNLATLTAPLPKETDDRDDPKPQRWDYGALLPVLVTLRDLASQLPPAGTPVNAETVWNFIDGRLQQAALGEFTPHLKRALLDHGGLILLDGLDEVPDALDRRVQIKQAVQDFVTTFGKCRCLVTSRTYAYQRQDWKLDGFAEAHLLPFTPGQIHRFVAAWYAHMVALYRLTESTAQDRAAVLKRAVERNERLRELAERPLLLTLIAELQTDGGGVLPEKREELYDKAVEMLLDRWERLKVRETRPDGSKEIEPSLTEWLHANRDDIRKQLNRLAFEAHRDQLQLTGTADIRQGALIEALLNASANREDVKVKLLENYLRDRAGILAAHGVGMYQFPHRSFQEYLAACHLTDDDFPDKLADLARDDPNRWREVALLAGAKAARGSSLSAWALAEALCVAPPPPDNSAIPAADHWGALLAGRVLVECTDLAQVAPRNADKRARVRDWQRTIMRRNTLPATERALAGRTLAVLGDPRPEVMTLDGMEFCGVPPGPFVMGDDSGTSGEKPQHTVDLAYPYFIARFPVTVAQWREYVQLSGSPIGDDLSLRGRANDPVVYVNWHDALRFCAFLTASWRGILPPGFVVTLPSEAEWEKAARGGLHVPFDYQWVTLPRLAEQLETMLTWTRIANPFPARDYPWGHAFDPDKANAESTIGETSAVGCYPAGVSPYGGEDMSGNIWEWTRSLWGKDLFNPTFTYPYDPNDEKRENLEAGEEVYRVLRGGSWSNHHDDARCASRVVDRPVNRFDDVGFRVVVRFSPVG